MDNYEQLAEAYKEVMENTAEKALLANIIDTVLWCVTLITIAYITLLIIKHLKK